MPTFFSTVYPLRVSALYTRSAILDEPISSGSLHLSSPKDLRMESAMPLSPSLTARAYCRYLFRILGPSFLMFSTWRSSGSNEVTMRIFFLALDIATFRRFSPPRLLSQPNLCISLPSLFLAYPTENMMTSRSSPWTDSMFLMKRPTSSPLSNLRISSLTSFPKDGSEAHSSSSTSEIRSLWDELKVMMPTLSFSLLLAKNSFRRATIFWASAMLDLSSQRPSTLYISMGGRSGSSTFGETYSLPP